jgi:hypothetical protein
MDVRAQVFAVPVVEADKKIDLNLQQRSRFQCKSKTKLGDKMDLSAEEKALIEQLRRGKQKEHEISNCDNIKLTNVEKDFLERQEYSLNAEIDLAIAHAEPAFKQMFPNVSTLAEIDRVISLLNFLSSHALRLKNSGYPDTHTRVTAILADINAARTTVAKTIGMLGAADRKDAENFRKEEGAWLKKQQELINNRLTQGQSQNEEFRKLL